MLPHNFFYSDTRHDCNEINNLIASGTDCMTYEVFSKLQFATLKKYIKCMLYYTVYLLDIYLHFIYSNIIHFSDVTLLFEQ